MRAVQRSTVVEAETSLEVILRVPFVSVAESWCYFGTYQDWMLSVRLSTPFPTSTRAV